VVKHRPIYTHQHSMIQSKLKTTEYLKCQIALLVVTIILTVTVVLIELLLELLWY